MKLVFVESFILLASIKDLDCSYMMKRHACNGKNLDTLFNLLLFKFAKYVDIQCKLLL